MPWYYYSGKVVRPIMIEKGRSVSVRPNTKVEIIDESTIEFKSLCRRGFLRRTSRPKNLEVDKKEISTKTVKDVVPKSKMAKIIAEKGITVSKDIPPESKFSVELTEGEQQLVENIKVEGKEFLDVDQVDKVEELSEDTDKKIKIKRRR
jgi:hypothetical protein